MYNGVTVLDVHGHVSSPEATSNYLMLMMAANTAFPNPLGNTARQTPGLSPDDFKAASKRHVDYMDARNIDVQIIGPRPFRVMGFMEEHLTPSWAHFVNDCIHTQCEDYPDRFIGAAQLPQLSNAPDTTHVLGELERCVKDLGFIATYASPDPGGRRTTPGMHEAYWHPLYAKCQEWDIPIIVHGTNALDRRFRVVPHNYQLGFYTEQYWRRSSLDTATSSSASLSCALWCATAAAGWTASTRQTRTCRRKTCPGTCSLIPARTRASF